jgi:hypothetical protein
MKFNKSILILLTIALAPASQADYYGIDATTGLAFDSNAYRAPSQNYIDYFADTTGNTLVIPDVQSGFFVPLDFSAFYDKKLNKKWRLIGEYDLDTRTYLDSDLSNADEQSHTGRLGTKYRIHNFNIRKSTVYGGLLLKNRKRDYYDRDTGLKKTTGINEDIVADKYNYSSQGFELNFDYWRKLKWDLKLGLTMEKRDYDLVATGSEYDNDFTRFDLEYDYRLNRTFRLAFDYAYYSYDYDERRARNLSGQLFLGNPLLKYDYNISEIALKHRINQELLLIYAYERTSRKDSYLGYNDYDQTALSAVLRYKASDKMTFRAELSVNERDYPNAWDYDRDPARFAAINGTQHKSSDGVLFKTKLDYQLNKQLELFAEIEYRDENNTDGRYNYERSIIMLGVQKEFF